MFDSFKIHGFLSVGEKADREILNSIETNFYRENNFDPKIYEIQTLLSSSDGNSLLKVNDVVSRRELLTNQLFVVNERVSKLIRENSSSYTVELQRVTVLKNDLEDSITICQKARENLRNAQRQITTRNLCLIQNERRKQQWIDVLRNIQKLKRLHSVDQQLKKMVKSEDFVGAIEFFSRCGSHIEQNKEYQCIRELSTKLQDTLDFIEESIDESLSKICSNFNCQTYQRLINAYELLGKSLTFMDQLQMHFVNVIQTRTMEIIGKFSGTVKNDLTILSCADLCRFIAEESISSCLHELNVCFWQIIKSYKLIWLWHEKNPRPSDDKNSDNTKPSQEFLLQKLETGSVRVWNEIQQKMRVFLGEGPLKSLKFENFLHILKMINRLIEIGEEFCQSDSLILEEAIRRQSVGYFRFYHHSRLEELKMFLENEIWQRCPVKSTFHITQLNEFRFLRETSSIGSNLTTSTSFNQKSEIDLFDRYLYTEREHPFDLDQTQTSLSSSSSQYSEFNDENSPKNLRNRTASHSSSDDDDEQNRRRKSKRETHIAPTIITNTTLNVTRLFGSYMEIIQMLKPIAFDVVLCLTQLFDYYLYTIYSLFACDKNEIPLNALTARLRSTIKRISENLFAEGKLSPAQLSPMVDINSSSSILYGLPQRIVAAESLVFISEQFDFLLPYLKLMIPIDRHSFLEQFYSDTVQVAQELRFPIYHNVSFNVIDYFSIGTMISKVNWDIGQIFTQHNAYVDVLVDALQNIRENLDKIDTELLPIPKKVFETLWDQILNKIFYTVVEGYASVRRCTIHGRALMQLDFEQLIRKLERIITEFKPLPHKEFVENYIKAYYFPEQSIDEWIRENTMYTTKQRLALVQTMTHLSKKKRAQLSQYLEEKE